MALTSAQLKQVRRTPPGQSRVRSARHAAGLTQESLAAELGITQSALSDLERQRYADITLKTASKFADFFGCAIEDLFPAKAALAS